MDPRLTGFVARAQGWAFRIDWLKDIMDNLHKEVWSPERLVGVMIDNFMSYADLRNLRQALTLVYEKDHDRFMHPIWLVSPYEKLFARPKIIRRPEPIPPVEQVREVYKKFEGALKIHVSEDGKIACHRFLPKVRELHLQHMERGLIDPSVGTPQNKHRFTYSFDAFPVDGLSIEHAVISSASMKNPSQSEEFCKIISVATIKENTEGLNRMHSARRVDNDVNYILAKEAISVAVGSKDLIHVEMFVCVDKKAVEVFRGCAPGCPWCECTADARLSTAWKVTTPPTSWSAASKQLDKVCRCPFPDEFDIYAYAHKALPFEDKPRYCKFCKSEPYKTVAEYTAHCAEIERQRSDVSKAGKAAFQTRRSGHASKHARQYIHEVPNLLVPMRRVIVEVMHLVELNVAKQCWTKGVVSLMGPYMRDMATQFFKGMDFKLDVKLKANGQSGTAWFKASAVNELVRGSTKVPGGLAPWMASLLFFVGEDFLAKQKALQPQTGAAVDCLAVLTDRYGMKGRQLFNFF